MSQQVKCFPPKDFMIAFLATRNLKIVEDKENVLHYFGDKFRELKGIMKHDRPDLVVIHNPEFVCDEEELQRFNYVIDYVTNDKEIYINKTVKTNNFNLCQLYYRKLGLMRTMDIYYKKPEDKPESKFGIYKKFVLNKMLWK